MLVQFLDLYHTLYLHLSDVLTTVEHALMSVSVWQKLCLMQVTEVIWRVKQQRQRTKSSEKKGQHKTFTRKESLEQAQEYV